MKGPDRLKNNRLLPRYRLSLPWTLLAAVLLAGAVTLLALWCQPNALRQVLGIFRRKPVLIVLNALPVGLFLLMLSSLFRNVFHGAALTNLIVCGLSIANRVKIEVRDEPVFPRDLAMLKEVGSIVGTYEIHYPVKVIAVVVLVSLALLAAGFLVGSGPFPVEKLRGWRGSLLGFGASLGALALVIVTLLGSSGLYESIGASNPYRLSVVFNETGFPYSFCHQFTTYLVDKPEGFSRPAAEEWQGEAGEGGGAPVHVVMVMNEGFSDITDHPAFVWPEETDPLPNLHALREDPRALTGHVVVPGFAGGTANTEFDVLTGIQTNALSATTTSAMRVVNRNLDSLFRVFRAGGYDTSFFHPGDDWFYNRENVYRWLGAEETVFADQMEEISYKGRWVTDDYMAGLIEEALEESAAAGRYLFHYTTTIQNHMSYTADKYGEDYSFPPLETTAALSEEARTMLTVYAEGVRDSDAMLGRLVETFSASSEPVLLVFWGDHLPYLGDNQMAYRELGMDVDGLAGFETPYVLWTNESGAKALDWDRAVEELDLPEELSAAFLGAAVLELTGRGEENPWFRFLNTLRREAPVIQRETCLLADGTLTTDIPAELAESVAKWRQWSYYKLKYEVLP